MKHLSEVLMDMSDRALLKGKEPPVFMVDIETVDAATELLRNELGCESRDLRTFERPGELLFCGVKIVASLTA
jgi:hypothetical protein